MSRKGRVVSARSLVAGLWRHARRTIHRLAPGDARAGATLLQSLARSAAAIGAAAPKDIPDAVVTATTDLGCSGAWFVVPRNGGVVVSAASDGRLAADLDGVVPTQQLAHWLTDGAGPADGVDRPGTVCAPVTIDGHPVAAVVATWGPAARHTERSEGVALRILASQAATALANADRVRTAEEVADRVREVERLRHDLVSTAAHELRTPTTIIRGVAELLDNRWDAVTDEQRRQLVSRVTHHVGALEHVLDQLASFSEFSAGAPELVDPKRLDLAALVARALDTRAELLAHHSVIRTLTPVEVLADANALEHIVGELLDNAATHTPPGTEVEVRIDRADDRARLVVTDDGPGTPDGAVATLTDPFARSGEVLTRPTRGIGLGLTFVDHAVRAHGGSLELVSDGGFRATVHLPVAGGRLLDHSERQTRDEAGTTTVRPAVLVVEDDESLRTLAELTLSDAGCRVTAVGDGRRAVRVATADRPDVVVLDVELPGLDGREVARLLRSEETTADVPIVVVTGSADRRDLWSIWSSGADALLMKPYDVMELVDTVLGLAGKAHGDVTAEPPGDSPHRGADPAGDRCGTA